MKLSIFWRMIIGHTLIVFLLITISFLALLKFNQLKNLTKFIITYDYPSLDLEKKLIDSILTQVGLERKYLVLEDPIFYQKYQAKGEEVLTYFDKLLHLTKTPRGKTLVEGAYTSYLEYLLMIEAEVHLAQSKEKYALLLYQKDKEKVINLINQSLNGLIGLSHQNMSTKIEESEETINQASKLIGIIAIVSILVSTAVSFLITRSINKPLRTLEHATKSIAQGDFNHKINIFSPPEMGELAKSFGFMCGRLQELDNLKKDFISNMSHGLRTPLTSIKEASHLLAEGVAGRVSQEQKEFLEVIIEEEEKLNRYISDLLDLSKIEAGMMTYGWNSCHLSQILSQAVRGMKPLAQKKDIHLDMDIQEGIPAVKADRERITQVVINLLSNAVKFTPPGGNITISANKAQFSASSVRAGYSSRSVAKEKIRFGDMPEDNQEGIKVSVSDTGPGIIEEDWEKVFDKFYQVNQGASVSHHGSGLGLSIAKHIVEDHGGKIWVEGGCDKGSTFSFLLPVDQKDR